MGPWALKFPSCSSWRRFVHGMLANDQERQFSAMGDPRLCPVVLGLPLGLLVVMPRAAPLSATSDDPPGLAEYLVRLEFGDLPVEPKASSFGHVGGRVVAVDYG